MENLTTPLKATFIAAVSAKLVVLLGMEPAGATTASTGLWVLLTAVIAYIVPVDLGARVGAWIGRP